jgi:hypothetical protein
MTDAKLVNFGLNLQPFCFAGKPSIDAASSFARCDFNSFGERQSQIAVSQSKSREPVKMGRE